jgi:RNA polymerase sigma-70 factor (ECF subfamily)
MRSVRPRVPTPAISSEPMGADLIARIAGGDADALSAAFRLYSTDVHRIALLITLSPDDADDVVQDVFIGLPEALRRYTERGAFRPWLHAVTTRSALMRLRARGRRTTALDPAELARIASVMQPDRATIVDALARIPVDQRTVFVLKIVEGYRHDEIAQTLGITRGASEVRLFRAIRALRALLEDKD